MRILESSEREAISCLNFLAYVSYCQKNHISTQICVWKPNCFALIPSAPDTCFSSGTSFCKWLPWYLAFPFGMGCEKDGTCSGLHRITSITFRVLGMSSDHDTHLCKQGSQNTQSRKYMMKNSAVTESFGQDLTIHHGKIAYTRATKNTAAFSFWVYISGLWRLINGAYLESRHKRQKISVRLHRCTPEHIFCFLSSSIP